VVIPFFVVLGTPCEDKTSIDLQKAQANAEEHNRALRAAVNAEIRQFTPFHTTETKIRLFAFLLKQPVKP